MKRIPMWRRYARMFGANPKADVRDELRFHLASKVDDLVSRGWSLSDAREEAERQFGDIRSIQQMGEQFGRDQERKRQSKEHWDNFVQDLRFGLRTLRKDRSFTAITVLILALGIAANTSVFSVVNAVLLRPLPFQDPDRLVWLRADKGLTADKRANAGLSLVTYTVASFEEFQRNNQSFQSVTGFNPFYGSSEYTLKGRGEPQSIVATLVAENFFQTLGVSPSHGRVFVHDECVKGGRPAAILSHGFWQRHFGGDPAIVGQSITLDDKSVTVVGIIPERFDFASVFAPGLDIGVYLPAVFDEIRNWGNTLSVIGRLKPGVSISQAQAEADVLFPRLRAAHKEWWSDYASTMTGLKENVAGKLRRSLILLWSAVGLILLIVCVNLSNLQLARSTARAKEFAVRGALGAGRWRLCRQLLTESVLLAVAGSLLGLGLAFALTLYLARQDAVALPLLASVRIDSVALLWTLLVASGTTVMFGLLPGLRLYAGNIQDTLKSSGQGMTATRGHERLRSMMVISEVAFACILLVGAGLLLRSFLAVLNVDLGFRAASAAVVKIGYDDGNNRERRSVVLQEILRTATSIPGIEAAGITDMLPLGRNRTWGFRAKDFPLRPGEGVGAIVRIVTPGYLAAMGMRFKSGRDLNWQDSPTAARVIIINEAAARLYWRGEEAQDRVALVMGGEARVIGVIADVRGHNIEAASGPEMYLPATQAGPQGAELVVRSSLPIESYAATLKRNLKALNPGQPVEELRPLQNIVDRAVSPRRFFVQLILGFAGLGLILASLGIYGVISYSVTRQTQEIGIRMALGASRGQVQTGVIAGAFRLALVGAILGGIGAFVGSRWIASLLFGTKPTDPVTFTGVILLLCLVALAAGYVPARRASRIEPMTALRNS